MGPVMTPVNFCLVASIFGIIIQLPIVDAFSPSAIRQHHSSLFPCISYHPPRSNNAVDYNPIRHACLKDKKSIHVARRIPHHHQHLATTGDDESPPYHPSNEKNPKSKIRNRILLIAILITSTYTAYTKLITNTLTLPHAINTLIHKISSTRFYQVFSLVFVSALGDKTFFIAGLLAMKAGKLVSFIGSTGALNVMAIISVIIGQMFHAVPLTGNLRGVGVPVDGIVAVIALTFFGIKMLKESVEGGDGVGAEQGLGGAEVAVKGSQTCLKQAGNTWGKIVSIFRLVFAAEFGDRSFISVIALSAAQNPVSVAVGAIAANITVTAIAVAGGSYLAKHISERTVGYIGGSLFLVFAFMTALNLF